VQMRSKTHVQDLRWLYANLPDHPITQFLTQAVFEDQTMVERLSPLKHAPLLPHIFISKREGNTFRFMYSGSWIEQICNLHDITGHTVEEVIDERRLLERLTVLKNIVDNQTIRVHIETLPFHSREHVEVLYVGVPLGGDNIGDVACIMARVDGGDDIEDPLETLAGDPSLPQNTNFPAHAANGSARASAKDTSDQTAGRDNVRYLRSV